MDVIQVKSISGGGSSAIADAMNARWLRDVQTLGEAVGHSVHAMARWAPGACPCNVPSLTGASREARVEMRITGLTALYAGRVCVSELGERGIPCAGLARPHAFDKDPEVVSEVGLGESRRARDWTALQRGHWCASVTARETRAEKEWGDRRACRCGTKKGDRSARAG